MNNNKFTVIIPTRERANTLFYCLRTCVTQSYQNFEILVSDNFSTDNTKSVVESFNDKRIKYINTGERLSMSKNWEFALSHVSEGWVCFIGDDDGLLPDSISQANELINSSDKEADVLFWYNIIPWYFWANEFGGTQNDNQLLYKLTKDWSPFVTKERVFKMASFEAPYESLPIIYHGFVSMSLINEIKNASKNNLFFQSCIPDIYSTIPISIFSKHTVRSIKPLSINGVSNNSTGGSDLFKKNNGKTEKRFLSELNIPFHSSLNLSADDKVMSNINILSTDAFLYFFDNVDSEYTQQNKDYKEYLHLLLINKLKSNRDSAETQIANKIIAKNNLESVELIKNKIFIERTKQKKYFHYRYSHHINCSKYNTKTIEDISKVYNQVINFSLLEKIKYQIGLNLKFAKRYIKYLFNIK